MDPAVGRCRASAEGMVFHHSKGASQSGYRICLDCGRAAEDAAGSLEDHIALMPAKGSGGRCSGNDKPFAITRPLALGHEVLTDVVELQPAALAEPGATWALASALREALARRLGIETRELGLTVDRRQSPVGGPTYSIFLHDQASGGAGYAPRLLDDLIGVLRDAATVLACPAQCERSCSACVLTPDLHGQQGLLDRRAALAFADGLLARMAEPGDDDVALAGAVLSPPIADAIVRRLGPGALVTIHLEGSLDLSALADPPIGTLLHAASRLGAEVKLGLPSKVIAELDEAERIGLRNASLRLGFEIKAAESWRAPNGALLLASLAVGGRTTLFLSRDSGASLVGPGWGVGSEHPVVQADALVPTNLADLPADALERRVGPGDKVRIIASDPGRPLRQFGSGLVERVLREDLTAAGLWRPGHLASLCYSDRYLHAPLPVALMMRTMQALRDALAPSRSTDLMVEIRTSPLREDRYGGSPFRLGQNWRDPDDRAETVAKLARR